MREQKLFNEICARQGREIDLCDARPSVLGSSFKRMNFAQMQYYLNYTKNTAKLKKELRKEVGWLKYYFYYTFRFTNAYNAHYYTRV